MRMDHRGQSVCGRSGFGTAMDSKKFAGGRMEAVCSITAVEKFRSQCMPGPEMDQKEFQTALEWRLCREFSGMSDRRFRYLWCDGVMLGAYVADDLKPRIVGGAWICDGDKQEEWRLELLLSRKVGSEAEIDWVALLPPADVTKWIAMDWKKKIIQIEPAAAVPDLERPGKLKAGRRGAGG
jgi:hypothetical protein